MPPRVTTDILLRAPVFAIENQITMVEGAEGVQDPNGPMTLDLDPNVLPEDQWIIEGVSFMGMTKIAPVDGRWLPPVSGLYICPPGTAPETQELANYQLNLRARPIPIPLDPYSGFRTFAAGISLWAGAVSMVGQSGFQVSVPGGWFLRAILVTRPGGAAGDPTGPGEESYGKLSALVRILRNLDLFEGDQ